MSAAEAFERSTAPRRYAPYPAYKDSGVAWLGEIPAHWELRRLKTFASVRLSNVDKKSSEGETRVGLCNYVDVYYNDRITSDLDFMPATASANQIRNFSLERDDVLITKDSESWTDIAVAAVVSEDLPNVLCGYHLAHIRPGSGCVGAFLARAFSGVGIRDEFHVAAHGITRFGLGGEAIAEGVFPLPSAGEQINIASFLDRETARIDGTIAKMERLIGLLAEKRQALIARAVTRGLDPNVPMKDSGIAWLGEIPAHWETKAIKFVAALRAGVAITSDDIQPAGDIPVYGGNGIRGFASANTHEGEFPLIGRQGALCGCVNFATGKFWASEHAIVASPATGIHSRWLRALLEIMNLSDYSQSAAQPGIAVETIGSLTAPVPPKEEQETIAMYAAGEAHKYTSLIFTVRNAIARLKELRTALISAAVTGKIDVREEAA